MARSSNSNCAFMVAMFYVFGLSALTYHVSRELDWYHSQRPATCKEYAWHLREEKRGCGQACKEYVYYCDIKVYVWGDHNPSNVMEKKYVAGTIGGDVRLGDTPDPSISAREDMCSSMLKEGPEAEYACYYVGDDDLIRKERTDYPLAALLGMILMWCPIPALCYFFVIRPVVGTLLSKSGLRASRGPNEVRAPAWARPSYSIDTAPAKNASPEPSTPPTPKLNGTRSLKPEDLCDELIPGLKLRAAYPFYGPVQRWFSATAISYDQTGKDTISYVLDAGAPAAAKGYIFTTEPFDGRRVRLHEDALGLVAKEHIRQGIIEHALFKGLSFQSLDANGDGELDADELTAGLEEQGINLDSETTQALLAGLDLDRTGKVTAANFRDFLARSNSNFPKLDLPYEGADSS